MFTMKRKDLPDFMQFLQDEGVAIRTSRKKGVVLIATLPKWKDPDGTLKRLNSKTLIVQDSLAGRVIRFYTQRLSADAPA